MKISEYFDSSEECVSWLEEEKVELEKRDAFLAYWFHEAGVGVVITERRSGELHAYKDGRISFYVSNMDDDVTSESSSTNDLQVVKNTYERYKSFVLGEEN